MWDLICIHLGRLLSEKTLLVKRNVSETILCILLRRLLAADALYEGGLLVCVAAYV
jgi:hypothetical protein